MSLSTLVQAVKNSLDHMKPEEKGCWVSEVYMREIYEQLARLRDLED